MSPSRKLYHIRWHCFYFYFKIFCVGKKESFSPVSGCPCLQLNLFIIGGGISSYAGQQGAAGHSLEACLKQAMVDIPQARYHLTPVYLGATAGMRLLKCVWLTTRPENHCSTVRILDSCVFLLFVYCQNLQPREVNPGSSGSGTNNQIISVHIPRSKNLEWEGGRSIRVGHRQLSARKLH